MIQPSVYFGGAGNSEGSPSGAPTATHLAMVSLSAADKRRSFSNSPVDGIGVPRRHRAGVDARGDRLRPGTRVFIRQQGHRSNLARPVTGRAVLVQDRRDVAAVCRVGRCGRRRLSAGLHRRGGGKQDQCGGGDRIACHVASHFTAALVRYEFGLTSHDNARRNGPRLGHTPTRITGFPLAVDGEPEPSAPVSWPSGWRDAVTPETLAEGANLATRIGPSLGLGALNRSSLLRIRRRSDMLELPAQPLSLPIPTNASNLSTSIGARPWLCRARRPAPAAARAGSERPARVAAVRLLVLESQRNDGAPAAGMSPSAARPHHRRRALPAALDAAADRSQLPDAHRRGHPMGRPGHGQRDARATGRHARRARAGAGAGHPDDRRRAVRQQPA